MNTVKAYCQNHLADINERDSCGDTPLMKSILHSKNPAISLYLIEEGADVLACNKCGEIALHFAVRKQNEITKKLIQKGAKVNATDTFGNTALHEAVAYNNYDAVCLLLSYEADVNAACSRRITPLMLAVYKNVDIRIQKILLDRETNINRTNADGCSILHFALQGTSAIVTDLLERGADVNQYTESRNALDLALNYNHIVNFNKIFERFDYDVLIASHTDPILFTLLYKRMDPQIWYELIELLIYSKQGRKIVHHCANVNEEMFFSRMFGEFVLNKLPQDKLIPIVAHCLSYGIKVYSRDLNSAYVHFGNGNIFQMLLYHGVIISNVLNPSLPILIADTKRSASEYLNSYDEESLYYEHLDNIVMLLRFGTPSTEFKDKFQRCARKIKKMYLKQGREYLEYENVLKMVKQMSVPTLKELSRDASRRYICSFYGSNTSNFYKTLKYMNIPEDVKQIINYQRIVNLK